MVKRQAGWPRAIKPERKPPLLLTAGHHARTRTLPNGHLHCASLTITGHHFT
jgi:hypothetical protein